MKYRIIFILSFYPFTSLYSAAAVQKERFKDADIPGNFCPQVVLLTHLLTSCDGRLLSNIIGKEEFDEIQRTLKTERDPLSSSRLLVEAMKGIKKDSFTMDDLQKEAKELKIAFKQSLFFNELRTRIQKSIDRLDLYELLVMNLAKKYSEMGVKYVEFLVSPSLGKKVESKTIGHFTNIFIAVHKAVMKAEQQYPIVMTPLMALDATAPLEENLEYVKAFETKKLFHSFGGIHFTGDQHQPLAQQLKVFETAKRLGLFCGADVGIAASNKDLEQEKELLTVLQFLDRIGGGNNIRSEALRKKYPENILVATCPTYCGIIDPAFKIDTTAHIQERRAHIGNGHDDFLCQTDPQTEAKKLIRENVVTLYDLYISDMNGANNAFLPKERAHLKSELKEQIEEYYKKIAGIEQQGAVQTIVSFVKASASGIFG